MTDLKKEAGIPEDSPFLTLCPGCGGNTYCYTNTHGKCEECLQLVHYDTLEEANSVFVKAQKILRDMMDTPMDLDTLDYRNSPLLKLMPKDD